MNESQEIEVVQTSALEQMERAQIDVQISTAKRYPRQLAAVKQAMLSFATLDQDTAASCFFTLPARKGGDGKPIQGPSIRMAEIALSTYGNIRAGARVIADDGKMLTIQGVCHDLQTNVCVTVETKRRVTSKTGQRFSDDMIVMTGNAGCSIALRNAVFRVVPLALVKPIYEAAKKTAVGDAKTLVQRRADALAHFSKMGVPKEKVFAALQVKGLEDIGLEHLEVLIGYANAIKEGETSIDEVFNRKPDDAPGAATGAAGGMSAALGGAGAATPSPASPADADLLKAALAEHGVTAEALFDHAKTNKLVPEGVADLWSLPGEVLGKLRFAVKLVATKGANGGAA
jgi:hypothetical protein